MKNRVLKKVIATVALLLCCMVANAQTTATIDGIKYELDETEKTATVVANRPTYRGDILIPETVEYNGVVCNVTAIGNRAFSGCTGLTSVTIPNSVTTIGDYAFSNCTRLTSINIPNSVYYIGKWAFQSCYNLTAVHINDLSAWCNINFDGNPLEEANNLYLNGNLVTDLVIPTGVTEIKRYAFSECTGLTSVTIPNSVTTIGESAFSGCTGLTSVTIPNSVTTIGEYAFNRCRSITSVSIPNSVTTIRNSAFSGCAGLTSITIPNSVTNIGELAFSGCTGLTSIVVESGNSFYDSRDGCNAIIETATNTLIVGCENTVIPEGITTIAGMAFNNCKGLTDITIPNSVVTIGGNAFYNCTGLTSVTIPNSVATIEASAFAWCISLTSVTIGNSVTNIGDRAFYLCDNITDIYSYINANDLFQIQNNTFSTTVFENATLHIPYGAKEVYSSIAGWSNFMNIVEDESMPILLETIYNDVLEYANSIIDDTAFGSHGLIKSESQLSTNAQEPTEGPIANLLDSDFMTYFHSTWSATNTSMAYHYLQIDLGEPLDAVALKYSKRTGTGFMADGSPVKVRVFATNDTNGEWNEVGVHPLSYTHAADTVAVGYKAIVLDNSYRHIRLQVEQTVSNKRDKNNLYFNLSEFGAWEARFEDDHIAYKDVPSNLMDELKAALRDAKSELMAGNDNEVTAKRLYTAFEAVKNYVPTGIEDIVADESYNGLPNTYYDLQGRIVEQPTQGIYIYNGKKVFIK